MIQSLSAESEWVSQLTGIPIRYKCSFMGGKPMANMLKTQEIANFTKANTAAKTPSRFVRYMKRNWLLWVMIIPGLIMLYIKMGPVFMMIISFQDYNAFKGVLGSPFVGLKHFVKIINDPYIWLITKNTVILALESILFSFPIPIIFALALNEVRIKKIRQAVQVISFVPYFISSAVMVSIVYAMLSPNDGLVNAIIKSFGMEPIFFMSRPEWFRPIYIGLQIWQTFGYNAIIYIAAITAIDPVLYESADIDGATRWDKIRRITLPSIQGTIMVMLIIAVGNIFSVSIDRILLMYNPSVYSTADVIQTYVYRIAFESTGFPNYSYGTAVNLIMSAIAFVLVMFTKKIANKYSENRVL